MEEGDRDTFYAMFSLHHFHWKPQDYCRLSRREKAAVMAMIDYKIAKMQEGR